VGWPDSTPSVSGWHDELIDLLARIHFIIVMIRWTGLAPWEFEFPFPGSLTSTCPDSTPSVSGWHDELIDYWGFGNDFARRSSLCPSVAPNQR